MRALPLGFDLGKRLEPGEARDARHEKEEAQREAGFDRDGKIDGDRQDKGCQQNDAIIVVKCLRRTNSCHLPM